MLRIIFKNLWGRRSRYAWLFTELIIITVITWYITDTFTVSIYDSNLPTGYDNERLAVVKVATMLPEDARYSEAGADSTVRAADFFSITEKLRHDPGVERICQVPDPNYINSAMMCMGDMRAGSAAKDKRRNTIMLDFYPGQEYFETYGIGTVAGSPSPEELSARSYALNEVVITRDYADLFWPGENAFGKKFFDINSDGDTINVQRVAGVIENVRPFTPSRSRSLVLHPRVMPAPGSEDGTFVVRLRPGTDPAQWVAAVKGAKARDFVTGNFYIREAADYGSILNKYEANQGVKAERGLRILLAIFFLINLILGVTGSFFLQTRRRIKEMGIHRATGATRSDIMRIIMGEAAILSTAACIAGCLIYLQIGLIYGFDNGWWHNNTLNVPHTWISDTTLHFGIISAIVYALILACSLLGAWLPAQKVSRITPVEALHNE